MVRISKSPKITLFSDLISVLEVKILFRNANELFHTNLPALLVNYIKKEKLNFHTQINIEINLSF